MVVSDCSYASKAMTRGVHDHELFVWNQRLEYLKKTQIAAHKLQNFHHPVLWKTWVFLSLIN